VTQRTPAAPLELSPNAASSASRLARVSRWRRRRHRLVELLVFFRSELEGPLSTPRRPELKHGFHLGVGDSPLPRDDGVDVHSLPAALRACYVVGHAVVHATDVAQFAPVRAAETETVAVYVHVAVVVAALIGAPAAPPAVASASLVVLGRPRVLRTLLLLFTFLPVRSFSHGDGRARSLAALRLLPPCNPTWGKRVKSGAVEPSARAMVSGTLYCVSRVRANERDSTVVAFDDVAVELLRRAGKEGTTRNLDGDDVTSAQNLF
jgi:hypothetical protein